MSPSQLWKSLMMIHAESLPVIYPSSQGNDIVVQKKTMQEPYLFHCTRQQQWGDFLKNTSTYHQEQNSNRLKTLSGRDRLFFFSVTYHSPGQFFSITPTIKKEEKFYITNMFLNLNIFYSFFSLEKSPFLHPKYCSPGYTVNYIAHVMTGRQGKVVTSYTVKK